MNSDGKIAIAAAGLAAVTAFAWRWRKNYRAWFAARQQRALWSVVPEDIIDGAWITGEEMAAFGALADFTCLQPCCYAFEDGDRDILNEWVDGQDD